MNLALSMNIHIISPESALLQRTNFIAIYL